MQLKTYDTLTEIVLPILAEIGAIGLFIVMAAMWVALVTGEVP